MPSASWLDDTTLRPVSRKSRRGNPLAEGLADDGPLVVDDAVPGGVAVLTVSHEHVLAMDAFECGRKCREGGPGALVERIRLELDAAAAEHVEGVLQLKQLRLRVGAGAPRCRC